MVILAQTFVWLQPRMVYVVKYNQTSLWALKIHRMSLSRQGLPRLVSHAIPTGPVIEIFFIVHLSQVSIIAVKSIYNPLYQMLNS